MNINTTALLVFLLAALSIALHDRRIDHRQFTFWAAHAIAVGMFMVGKLL